MKAPGSPSSALQMTYFSPPRASMQNCHLRQVGNPAPPRPRSPERLSSSTIWAGLMRRARCRPV